MKALGQNEELKAIAEEYKKPLLFLSFSGDFEEILKAAPYLNAVEHGQQILNGYAVLVCEDEDEQEKLYWATVGDDGPTKTNPYEGPARVYALTVSRTGEPLNENT
jgi:hypothetical protein